MATIMRIAASPVTLNVLVSARYRSAIGVPLFRSASNSRRDRHYDRHAFIDRRITFSTSQNEWLTPAEALQVPVDHDASTIP